MASSSATRDARSIGETRDFSRRVAVPRTIRASRDEVTRLAVTFNQMLSQLQGAYGELEHTLASQRRFVASALHGRKLARGQWASSFVWGANRIDRAWSHSLLFESEAILDESNTVFGRAELGRRTAEALAVSSTPPTTQYRVGAASLGYVRELARGSRFTTGIGARGTLNVLPGSLTTDYGSRFPAGFLLFVRVRPVHGVMMEM